MIVYAGNQYDSEIILCKAYQYSYGDFCALKEKGMDLPEIMLTLAPSNNRTVVYQGIVYINRKEMCDTLGLDYYRYRNKFEATGDIDASVEYAKEPPVSRKPVEVCGETYPNYTVFCEQKQISYASFMSYIHVRGLTPDEAYQRCVANKQEKQSFPYKGKIYPSLLNLCNTQGWSYTYFNSLLRKGVPYKQAVVICENRTFSTESKQSTVVYKKKTYRSLHALTEKLSLVYPEVFQSIADGLTVEQAIDEALERKQSSGRTSMYKGKATVVKGIEFESIKTALDYFGIKQTTYYMKKSANPGLTAEELILQILADQKYAERKDILSSDIVIRKKKYHSRKEVFSTLGVSQTTIYSMMRKKGLSFEAAVELYLDRREKRAVRKEFTSELTEQNPIIINEITYPSVKSAMESLNISMSTLNNQVLKTGESPRDALMSIVAKAMKQEPIIIFGKQYPSKNAVYNEFGLNAYKVGQCMSSLNLSFSKAVESLVDKPVPSA